jgi:hypothetical protein
MTNKDNIMQNTENTDQIPNGDELVSDNDKEPTSPENSDIPLGSIDPPTDDAESEVPESYAIPSLPGINETPGIDAVDTQEDTPPSEKETLLIEEEMVESKLQSVFRRLIRWAAGLLIIFGLGLLTGIYMFYKPATQEAERNIKSIESVLNLANEDIEKLKIQISDRDAQIIKLQPYEAKNDELLIEHNNLILHIAILDARVDISNALVEIGQEDIAQARIILNQTEKTLDRISDLLEQDMKDAVIEMKTRLELILGEIDRDPYAAQSDLDVLEEQLLHLEDSLITK